MGKQQSAPPPAVDYGAQANAQGQANIDASRTNAQLNRVNQYTPYGSQIYTPGSTPDSWESTITLSPDQQSLLDKQSAGEQTLADTANTAVGRVQSTFGQPLDTSGAPSRVNSVGTPNYDMYSGDPNANLQKSLDFSSLGTVPGANDFGAQKQQVEDALYRESTAKLDPQYAAQEEAMRSRLANSGIAAGSDAFNQEMDNFNRQKQTDYGDARDRSILAGGQEQSRLNSDSLASRSQMLNQILQGGQFQNSASGQGLQQALAASGFNNTNKNQSLSDAIASGNFQNQARGASIDEAAYMRSLPLNEYNALISGAQVTNPSFANTPQVAGPAPAPVFAAGQAQNQNAMDLYNQQIAQNNSNVQSGTGLIGALGSAAIIF